jgi:hypothetical protein
MINIIVGSKGTGKTKMILDAANNAVEVSKGDCVFLTTSARYGVELKPQLKVIDATEENICNKDAAIGFIKGMLASNYDIEYFFIDGFYKILGAPVNSKESEEFFAALEKYTDVKFTVTVSCDKADLPAFIAKYQK